MWKDLFSTAAMLDLPLVVMFFFMGVFFVVLARVFSKKRRPHYDHMSRLPLDESEAPEVVR